MRFMDGYAKGPTGVDTVWVSQSIEDTESCPRFRKYIKIDFISGKTSK